MQFDQSPRDDGMGYTSHSDANVSLLGDGNDEQDDTENADAGKRVDRHMTLRERLESFKQQASVRFESITRGQVPSGQDEASSQLTMVEICNAVQETVIKLTDPLYRDLDYENTLVFIDDIKSWSGGMPQMLPIVVQALDKRLKHEDPQVTSLALALIDTLVKNTRLNFHRCVATQPLMSNIARIARGSAHPIDKLTGDLRKDASAIWKRFAGKEVSELEKASRERCAQRTSQKAKEVIRTWGEGFVQTSTAVPLFASTYQTLLNEGMEFPDVEGAVVLDSPEDAEFEIVGGDIHAPDMSELSNTAHQAAKLLSEVCASRQSSEEGTGLVDVLIDQCKALQAQVASHMELAMATSNETQLISTLATNEVLQEALDSAKNGFHEACKSEGSKSEGGKPSKPPTEFESVMGDVDQLLFDEDNQDEDSTNSENLLDLGFFTPAAAPPVMPPTSHVKIPPPAPIAPPQAPPATDATILDDDFAGLALQRKHKNQLQEL
jgi:hypothetical protein